MTSFALVIWAYEQSGSALSTVGVLVLLSTDALCVWCVGAVLGWLPIPLGYLLGGALVDTVFEPFMAAQTPESLFCCLFGTGKGSGAAFLFLVLGFLGVAVCLGFRRSKLIRGLEANDKD